MVHSEIQLNHAEWGRWCLDCHDADDRDQLHLTSGELVPFEESYRLCGQCHGDKLRDRGVIGVHGRRTGALEGRQVLPPVRSLSRRSRSGLFRTDQPDAGLRRAPRA